MDIAVIDAEIVDKTKHRFPNLCCMKISAYHKSIGDNVTLKTDYENLEKFDRVYISKVFIKTRIPFEPNNQDDKTEQNVIEWYKDNPLLNNNNISYGGTGFYYDKSPPLPSYIEHMKPDYHLYDEWVDESIRKGANVNEFSYYRDYSIGYLTRKCFRQCYYCVNRNYKRVETASPLYEFLDEDRPKICLLDDNFFGTPNWKDIISPVKATGKPFQFKQGLDERLITNDKISEIMTWKYDGELIFAFDNIEDRNIIEEKLKLITNTDGFSKRMKFYVFCGCDRSGRYDDEFYHEDIKNLFERIRILNQYGALPYVMRFEKVYNSEFSSFYAAVAGWCNQPSMFYSFPFDVFCKCKGMGRDYTKYKRDINKYVLEVNKKGAPWKALELVSEKFPDIEDEYFSIIGQRNTLKRR